MDKNASRDIIHSHNLIKKKKSHEILKAIQDDIPLEKMRLPDNINIEKIENLISLYKEKKKEIETQYKEESYPSNLPFYFILKDKYPTFSWTHFEIKKDQHSIHYAVNINAPRVQNLQVSLLSLLVSNINTKIDTPLQRKYPFLSKLPFDLVYDLEKLLQDTQILHPDSSTMEKLVEWLEKGLQGQPLVLFSPVCPDYSVEKVKKGSVVSYRYTFNELGTSVGLLAKNILKALPHWHKFFKKNALDVRIIVALGDFEADDESNLQRVNLTFEEFLARLEKSRAAIQKSSKVPIETQMITDLCGGFEAWNMHLQKFKLMFSQNEYGYSNLNAKKLLDIIKARRPLYNQWYGEKSSLDEYLPLLLAQGAGYTTMSAILTERYNNCLILGADHSAMRPFYNVNQVVPVLYIKSSYL